MNKKELIKFAHNLLPIRNHFGSRKDRMQNWICRIHSNETAMGVCLYLPNLRVIHGANFEWEAYETIFKTERNVISISKTIVKNDNEKEIRSILLHEIEHSKMSLLEI